MTLGERIKLLRKRANLTQQQFAEKLNLKQTTIGRYEKNAIKPSFLVLLNIARICKVEISWLLSGQSNNLPEANQMKCPEAIIKAAQEKIHNAAKTNLLAKYKSATASVTRRNKIVQEINGLRQVAQDLLDRIILLQEEIKQ